jgi:hypothetical protein
LAAWGWLPHQGYGTAGWVFDGLGKFLQRREDVPTTAGIDLLQNSELPLDEVLPHSLEQYLPLGCQGQTYGTTISGILTALYQSLADQFLDGAAGRTGRDVQ